MAIDTGIDYRHGVWCVRDTLAIALKLPMRTIQNNDSDPVDDNGHEVSRT